MAFLRNADGTHAAGPAFNRPLHGAGVGATEEGGVSVRIEGLGTRALHVNGQASMVVCGVAQGKEDDGASKEIRVRVSLVDGASGAGESACAGGGEMGVAGCVESPFQEFVLRRRRELGGACACGNCSKAAEEHEGGAREGDTPANGGVACADEDVSSRDMGSGGSTTLEGSGGRGGVQGDGEEEDAEEGCGQIRQRASTAWATLVYHLDYLKGTPLPTPYSTAYTPVLDSTLKP